MTLDEFTRHAQAWGADIARWPDAARDGAAGIAASPQAEAVLAEQRALDALLSRAAPQIAPERAGRAMHAVVARLAEDKPRARLADLLPRWLVPAAGLACAVGIGALVAMIGPLAEAEDVRSVLTMFFDANPFGQGFVL